MSAWQPIATVPKDAPAILFNADEQSVGAGMWQGEYHAFAMCDGDMWFLSDLTHWQPLPDAPQTEQARAAA